MTIYTFTFEKDHEQSFRRIRDRLDPEEYTIIEDIHQKEPEKGRQSDLTTVMDMDAEAALTFRLGMKHLIIRRERSEEELKEEAEIKARNTVKVTVYTGAPDPSAGGTTP
jgi:hypothetical protein